MATTSTRDGLVALIIIVAFMAIFAVLNWWPTWFPPRANDGTPNIGVVGSAFEPSFTIGDRTDFAFIASDGDPVSYRPMDFQFNGQSVASVAVRGGDLVYSVGGKEVDRAAFYDFMDAWLRRTAGIWKAPK